MGVFANWSVGEKIIFITTCVAVISFFLPWIDIGGILSYMGIQTWAIILLGLYVYPMVMLLMKKPINGIVGIVCGAIAVLAAISFISGLGELGINFSGVGVYVFLASSVGFAVGNILVMTEKRAGRR